MDDVYLGLALGSFFINIIMTNSRKAFIIENISKSQILFSHETFRKIENGDTNEIVQQLITRVFVSCEGLLFPSLLSCLVYCFVATTK